MEASELIAIIDDDDSALEAALGLVRALGFVAVGFHSAGEYLQSQAMARTACLIADLRMPEMNGLELFRHLTGSGNPIPTILMTAYSDEGTRAQALKTGIRWFLAKPLDPEELLRCIRSALAHEVERPSDQ